MECKVTLFDNEFERSFSNCSKEELDIIINFIKTSYYDGEINFQDSYGYLTNVNEKKIKKFLNKKILVKLTDENLDKLEILFTKIDEIPNQKEAIDKVKSNKKKTVKSNGEKSVLKEDASAPSSEITSLKEDISVTEKVTLEENLNLYTEKSNVKSIKNNSEVENIIGEPKIKKKKKKNISKEDNSSLDISKLNISDIKESVPNETITEKKKSNKKKTVKSNGEKSVLKEDASAPSSEITSLKEDISVTEKVTLEENLNLSTEKSNVKSIKNNSEVENIIGEPKIKKKKKKNISKEDNSSLDISKLNISDIKESVPNEPVTEKKKSNKKESKSEDLTKSTVSDNIKESVSSETITEKKKSNKKESKSEDLTKSTVSENIQETVSNEPVTEKKKSNKKESKSEDLTKSTVSENIQETVSNEPVIEEPKVETNIVKKDKKIPKCSKCGQTGHNSRTCTLNK